MAFGDNEDVNIEVLSNEDQDAQPPPTENLPAEANEEHHSSDEEDLQMGKSASIIRPRVKEFV